MKALSLIHLTIFFISSVAASPVPVTESSKHWSPKCGQRWIYNSMDSCCYQVDIGAAKTWLDARSDCLRQGSDLVSIGSPQEQGFLQGVLSTCDYAGVQDQLWIGANDKNSPGQYEWSNKAHFRYFNWHPGPPNSNVEEACFVMVPSWDYQWDKTNCSVLHNYICKKSALSESTISSHATRPTQATKDTSEPTTSLATTTAQAGSVTWSHQCGPNWIYNANDSTCYQVIVGNTKDMLDAKIDCQRNGSELVSIDGSNEQAFLQAVLSTGQYASIQDWFWIGASSRRREGEWTWNNNPKPFNYSNWNAGQPNNIFEELCTVIVPLWQYKWDNKKCSLQNNYICEKPASKVSTTTSLTTMPAHTEHASPKSTLSTQATKDTRGPTTSLVKTTTQAGSVTWSHQCGPNWIYNANGSTCYQVIVGNTKDMLDAKIDCQRNRSELVSIDGPNEQAFLQAVLSTGQYASIQDWFWIGASSRRRVGEWTWNNNPKPFIYSNWNAGQPNNIFEELCTVIVPLWQYKWDNKKCSLQNNYICEKPASKVSTTTSLATMPAHTEHASSKSTISTPATKDPCNAQPMISGTYSLPYGQRALLASSSRDAVHGAEASRLTASNRAAWSAATNAQGQWISATFYNIIITRGIKIMGRRDTNEWVTKFKLMYQYDYFSPWYTYQDPPGTDTVFNGNHNSYSTVMVNLSFPIEAKSIKLIPTAWFYGISLKWEIYGCIQETCSAEYGVSGPLFVEDGGFSSSSIRDPVHSSHHSRLHSNGPNYIPSCWKPMTADHSAWLEVNLGSVMIIRGVTTAGNPAAGEWVTKYQVLYSLPDGSGRFHIYQEPYGKDYIFTGNIDNGALVTNMLKSDIQAQKVRILVISFRRAVALRVDLLVCPMTCRAVPLINGPQKLSDSQLTASSSLNSDHGPQRSRLNQPAQGDYIGGWEAEFNDKNQYIQVDLGRVVEVTAVATQGRDDANQYVRAYTLASSSDGVHWYPYYMGKTVQIFGGNWDSKTVRKHYLMIPMNVRYVRLQPTDWQNRISMRWELYGCPGPMSGTPVGCYGDKQTDRDLPYEPLTDPTVGMWPPMCIHHCYLKGYLYAGLQNGFECFCGNSYGKYGPAANCSMPCFPHSQMKCGGPMANNIHNTGLPSAKTTPVGRTNASLIAN